MEEQHTPEPPAPANGEDDDDEVPERQALIMLEEELPQEVGHGDAEANAKVDPFLHDVPDINGDVPKA